MKINFFNSKIISLLILLLFTFTILVSASYAWFASFINVDRGNDFHGSSVSSYFAEGEGTEEKPYVINRPNHLYNLAWLQNKQPPVFTETTHFVVCESLANPVAITLDMAGEISGLQASGGAIPPIGTKTNPFIGHFDGCGSIISNLWISTNKEDWKEQPSDAEDYVSTHVGMFGAVSNEAIVENFVLDRIELTTSIDSTVGIICGYVDALICDVGVYNGILNVESGINCKSAYTLLGEITDRVVWDDMPSVKPGYGLLDRGGGDLVIDPNNYSGTSVLFEDLDSGTRAVENAIVGTAYFSASLEYTTTNKNAGKITLYDLRAYHNNGYKNKKDAVEFTEATLGTNPTRSMQQLWDIYGSYTSGSRLIKMTAPFNTNNEAVGTVTTKDINNIDIVIPTGCIWFKPQAAGKVAMIFCATDQSKSRYAMLYVCKREGDVLIPIVDKCQEYLLPVDEKIINNGDMVYHEYEITQEEYEEGYEYVIGVSNIVVGSKNHSQGSFGFYALMLAGTDVSGGQGSDGSGSGESGEFIPVIYDVDYVTSVDVDVSAEGYKIHQSLLHIDQFTATEEKKLYYLAKETGDTSKVYYYPDGVTVIDIAVDQQSVQASSKDGFDDRDET